MLAAGEVLVSALFSLPTLSPPRVRLIVGETERNPDRARDLPRVIQLLRGFQVIRLLTVKDDWSAESSGLRVPGFPRGGWNEVIWAIPWWVLGTTAPERWVG